MKSQIMKLAVLVVRILKIGIKQNPDPRLVGWNDEEYDKIKPKAASQAIMFLEHIVVELQSVERHKSARPKRWQEELEANIEGLQRLVDIIGFPQIMKGRQYESWHDPDPALRELRLMELQLLGKIGISSMCKCGACSVHTTKHAVITLVRASLPDHNRRSISYSYFIIDGPR